MALFRESRLSKVPPSHYRQRLCISYHPFTTPIVATICKHVYLILIIHCIYLHVFPSRWCKNKETNGHVKSTSEGQSTSDDEDVILPGIDPMTAVRMRNNRKWSQPRSLSTMSLIDDSEFSQVV